MFLALVWLINTQSSAFFAIFVKSDRFWDEQLGRFFDHLLSNGDKCRSLYWWVCIA